MNEEGQMRHIQRREIDPYRGMRHFVDVLSRCVQLINNADHSRTHLHMIEYLRVFEIFCDFLILILRICMSACNMLFITLLIV